MAFIVTHRYGAMERDPSLSIFAVLLQELEERLECREHASVSVTHDSEWCISASQGGYIALENLEDVTPRHMRRVPKDEIVRLWTCLANGDLEAIEQAPWQAGY